MSKSAKFLMEKVGDTLRFCGTIQRRLYDAWKAGLPDKQIVEATFAKQRHEKTLAQLGYWHAVLMPFACQELRAAGWNDLGETRVGKFIVPIETTGASTDILFKTLFGASRKLGHAPLKRNMSTVEMAQLIDFTMDWLAKNLGVIAPQPERRYGLRAARQQRRLVQE